VVGFAEFEDRAALVIPLTHLAKHEEASMDVQEVAKDTFYATVGVTSLAATQLQERAKDARERVEKLGEQLDEERQARRERVDAWVSRVESTGKELQDRVEALNSQLRQQLDSLVKLNEKARESIEARLPEPVVNNIEQLRQQIRDLTEQVQKQVQAQVDSVQKLARRAA